MSFRLLISCLIFCEAFRRITFRFILCDAPHRNRRRQIFSRAVCDAGRHRRIGEVRLRRSERRASAMDAFAGVAGVDALFRRPVRIVRPRCRASLRVGAVRGAQGLGGCDEPARVLDQTGKMFRLATCQDRRHIRLREFSCLNQFSRVYLGCS